MRNLITVYTIVGLLLLAGCSSDRLVHKGDRQFERLAYSSAIKFYEKAQLKGKLSQGALARLGDSYRLINDARNSVMVYRQLTRGKYSKEYDLYHAKMLMEIGDYEAAVTSLQKYRERGGGEGMPDDLELACNEMIRLSYDQGNYELVPVNINSAEAEFGPSIYQGKLYFSSSRKKDKFKFKWNDTNFLDLYAANFSESGRLGTPDLLQGNINSNFHESNACFQEDGEKMFFTRNNFAKGKLGFSQDRVIKLKIFEARKRGEKWIENGEFPFNSDEYSVGHPAFSENGEYLIFASDMEGGFGGVDLYSSKWNGKNWTKPKNLGSQINTPGDEMFPWAGSGKLFFASDGHLGIGGLDIFQVEMRRDLSLAGTVENLGAPINSQSDDFQFILTPKGKMGFFTSNRAGGEGDDDIFAFRVRKIWKATVVEKGSSTPLDGVLVSIKEPNGTELNALSDSEGFFQKGIRGGTVLVTFSKDGYKSHSEKVVLSPEYLNEVNQFELEPLFDCEEEPMVLIGTTLQNGELQPGTLVKIKQKEMFVRSDASGGFKINLPAGFEYEVSVVDDNPTSIVTEEITTIGLAPGSEIPVELALEDGVEVEDLLPGTDTNFVVSIDTTPFYIIYYDYDKSNIRKDDARPELDRVARFMQKKPEIRVKVSSHTDSRGADSYNLALSRKRAYEAMIYLVKKGVSRGRLEYSFHGEKELTNDCGNGINCSEEDHQINRRTEFRILQGE